MPRITRNTPSRKLGFKGDFFSEVLHEMRSDLQYADYVSHSLRLPQCEDMRDNKAIARITEGYLKLLFPDLNLTDEEFIEYSVNPAVRMRQQIRDELAKMDQEYKWVTIKSEHPDEFQATHPETMPEPAPQDGKTDPFLPKRQPVEMTVDLAEGQRGMSYERLFAPYLRGAKRVKIVDPYIRYDYQIHNLINFCEFIAPEQYDIELTLLTAADSLNRKLSCQQS
jgi:ATP-dependent Lon protease